MTPFRETAAFIRGRRAEKAVAVVLQSHRWYIIPSYDYSGEDGNKAPLAQGAHDGIVLPDLGMAKSGVLKWAEVKYKWVPTWTRITATWDHGIGFRSWKHYCRVQRETGCHVWLFIIEGKSQMLLMESLDVLGEGRCFFGDGMDRGGMMFWPRAAFRTRWQLASIPGLLDAYQHLPFEEA